MCITAKGLSEAKKKLDALHLSAEEKIAYKSYLKKLRDIASEQHTKMADAKKLLEEFDREMEEGVQKGKKEAVLGMYEIGISVHQISKALKISEEKVRRITQEEHKK